jgi:hypothetical protein
MLPENGVFGNFDPGASMLTPQTNFHFSEPRKLKSPKNLAKAHVKPQNPENPPQKIRNLPKINSLQPENKCGKSGTLVSLNSVELKVDRKKPG